MPDRVLKPVLFVLALIVTLPAVAAAQEPDTRLLTVEDLFQLESISSPVVNADGSLVAYVVSTFDMEENSRGSAVWMVSIAGGDERRMTAAASSASSPRFSPDGQWLSFLATRGEDAEQQVWAMSLSGGEAQPLTDVKQGVASYEWAPDSRRLALLIVDEEPEREEGAPQPPYVIDRLQFKQDYVGYLNRRRPHVYVYDLESEELRQLTSGDTDHSGMQWSPDGTRIAFVANRTADPDRNTNSDVWVIDAGAAAAAGGGAASNAGATGAAAAGAAVPEPIRVSTGTSTDGSPAWSPDGTRLTWLTTTRPDVVYYALSHVAVGAPGEEPRVLTEYTDRNIRSLTFAANGEQVLGLLESEGSQNLVAIPVDGGPIETVWGGVRYVQELVRLPAGGAVVAASTHGEPANLWTVDHRGEARRLTDHNKELLAELRFGRVTPERFKSLDGTEIEAFYTFPPDADEGELLPTIMWIHGGPAGQDGWGWHALRHLFAAHGYLVVQPNYRGSHGYGQEFGLALWQNWGGPEPVDSIAAVDHAIARGWADPERLGVGGWSYGGITTNAIITQTTRFKAAVSGAGAALWIAGYGHDQYQLLYTMELGRPWENPDLWARTSPFYDVANITTPTLWMGGERDWNVPIRDSELMYQSMKELGRETLLVVYPDQHHGDFPPAYEKDRYRRFLGWFGKYLKGDGSAWPDES